MVSQVLPSAIAWGKLVAPCCINPCNASLKIRTGIPSRDFSIMYRCMLLMHSARCLAEIVRRKSREPNAPIPRFSTEVSSTPTKFPSLSNAFVSPEVKESNCPTFSSSVIRRRRSSTRSSTGSEEFLYLGFSSPANVVKEMKKKAITKMPVTMRISTLL